MANLVGQEWGPYRILEQIGAGGMATVYKAYHKAMERYVAIKILPEQMSHDVDLRKRFDREVKVIARLEHPRILPVYDSGQVGHQLYLVMRYIQTGTLRERMAARAMGLEEIKHVIDQVGAALEYAHRLGVVHRDVKPSNILLDEQGDCYLGDFGLARIAEASVQLTTTGVGVGTPAYMSPEQGQGEKVDARSDIYSLGVMLYEMVTGRVPYQAETPMALVLKHINAPLPLPHTVKPDVPPQVEQVIVKALAKNPAHRFQTMAEMVAALDEAVRLAAGSALPAVAAAGEPVQPEVDEPAAWLPGTADAKKCPLCAEMIQSEAQVCRYCGARFRVSIQGDCPQCQSVVEVDEQGWCSQCGGPVQNRRIESAFLGEPISPPVLAAQPEPLRELNIWGRQGEGVLVRFSASLFDSLAILAISAIIVFLMARSRGVKLASLEDPAAQEWARGAAAVTVLVIRLLYFTLLEGAFGTTLGKRAGAWPSGSLRVVKKDGTRCGYARAAVRALFGLLETNPLGALVIWITPLHQRIGDLVAGTLVVNMRKPLSITFHGRAATFELADGSRVVIDELLRGTRQRWLNRDRMQLTGVTPEGKRARLRDLAFPDDYRRGQVKDELERFFKVQIIEDVQWWRLLPALVGLVVLTVVFGNSARLAQDGRTPDVPRMTPTRRATAIPTSTRAPGRGAQVKGDNVNLRAGPGTVYPVSRVLKQSTRLTALERTASSEWFRVKVDDTGQMGWISITVVEIQFDSDDIPIARDIPPTPQPAATPALTPQPVATPASQ